MRIRKRLEVLYKYVCWYREKYVAEDVVMRKLREWLRSKNNYNKLRYLKSGDFITIQDKNFILRVYKIRFQPSKNNIYLKLIAIEKFDKEKYKGMQWNYKSFGEGTTTMEV